MRIFLFHETKVSTIVTRAVPKRVLMAVEYFKPHRAFPGTGEDLIKRELVIWHALQMKVPMHNIFIRSEVKS